MKPLDELASPVVKQGHAFVSLVKHLASSLFRDGTESKNLGCLNGQPGFFFGCAVTRNGCGTSGESGWQAAIQRPAHESPSGDIQRDCSSWWPRYHCRRRLNVQRGWLPDCGWLVSPSPQRFARQPNRKPVIPGVVPTAGGVPYTAPIWVLGQDRHTTVRCGAPSLRGQPSTWNSTAYGIGMYQHPR